MEVIYKEGFFKVHKFYRIRVGNYLIGIKYIYPDVLVITIAVRGEIYKGFPPKQRTGVRVFTSCRFRPKT